MKFNYLKWLLLIGIFMLASGSVLASTVEEIQIPYYARLLDGPAYEILCLNTREAANPIYFGHSSLTSFRIVQDKALKKGYTTNSAISTGYWPYKRVNNEDSEHKAQNLQFNNPADYFLMFNKNAQNRRGDRHCVPITKSERVTMDAFISKNKKKKWSVLYNCNDISSKAFAIATGIEFKSRSPVTAYLSHPRNMVKEVEKYHKIHQPAGSFTFAPDSDSEKKVLSENIKIQADIESAQKNAANIPRRAPFKTNSRGNR
jgi:hypothetical protein